MRGRGRDGLGIVPYSAARADKERQVVGSILGTRVLRVEDPRFITTGGRYVDDLRIDGDVPFTGAAVAHYVRSAVAHGTITAIDTGEARAMPDVIAVFTAADLGPRAGAVALQPRRRSPAAGRRPGALRRRTARRHRRRRRRRAAADAADTVVVDYDVLDAYVDPLAAMAGDTLLFDGAGNNVVFDSTAMGMPGLSDGDFFAGCDVVVSGHFVNQRMAPCPLEPRSAAAAWVDGRLYVWMSTQHAQGARDLIARSTASTPPPCGSSPPTSAAGSAPRSRRTRRSCCSAAWRRSSAGRWPGWRLAASR